MTDVHGQNRSHAIGDPAALKKGHIVARIYFRTNQHSLDGIDKFELKKLGRAASNLTQGANATSVFHTKAFADHRGKRAYNKELTRKRTLAVVQELQKHCSRSVVYRPGIYGEDFADQEDQNPTATSMRYERRVDVYFNGNVTLHDIPGGSTIEIPNLPEIVDKLIPIVKAKKQRHPSECRRILCYLQKLKSGTARDYYWDKGSLKAAVEAGYAKGYQKHEERVDHLNRSLARTRKKAGPFVRFAVDAVPGDAGKFQRLMDLDRAVHGGWGHVNWMDASGTSSGGIAAFPYWRLIKKLLDAAAEDNRTLYHCIPLH